LAQLTQIPQLIPTAKPLWNHMIYVHWAFALGALLATTITLQH
jgi:hypothetical protein